MASRREAERLILAGKIMVNGKVERTLGTKIDPAKDRVEVLGRRERRAILLNKPEGYVVTKGAKEGQTIYHWLPKAFQNLAYVGRLDKGSSGMLILTDDGVLASHLTAEKYAVEKEYEVKTQEDVTPAMMQRLSGGIRLSDGLTKPAHAMKTGKKSFQIVLVQGKNRQIRRMAAAVGLTVVQLTRVRIGDIGIRNLKPGEWRVLAFNEINLFKN